jgi:type IV pilus assembly protein PilE
MNRITTGPAARARMRGVTLLRTEARIALLQVQANQEKFFLQNNRYADTAELSLGTTADPPGLGVSATTPGGHYTIALEADATTYTATATATGGQAEDAAECRTLSINQNGDKVPAGNGCWR